MKIELSAYEVIDLRYALSKAIRMNNELMEANPNLENDLHPINVRLVDLDDLLAVAMKED